MFTIQAVWDDSVAFMRRERALIVPLALATLGLGNMVVTLAQATSNANPANPATIGLQLLVLVGAIWMTIGKLGLIALALRSQFSVGEALKLGAQRLGVYILIAFMLALALSLLLVPLAPQLAPQMAQLQRNDFSHLHIAGWARLWILALALLVIFVSTRLFVLEAFIVDRKGSPIALLKQSYDATRGVFWRLLLFTLAFSLFAFILAAAISASFGSIFAIIGKLLDTPFTGKVLEALVQSILAAGLGAVEAVFTAKAYQRLTRGQASNALFSQN
jgi:hypothetical protein